MSTPTAADVLAALRACSNLDAATREPAEAALRGWEASEDPGYYSALLSVVADVANVPSDLRLLAAILAKNGVPKVWGRARADEERLSPSPGNGDIGDVGGSGGTESGAPRRRAAERETARVALPRLLFGEPDERIALHLRLALANASLFDYPDRWPSLLSDLAAVAGTAEHGGPVRVRAAKAIRDVLQAARHRKLIVKEGGVRSLMALQRLAVDMMQEKARTRDAAAPAFGTLATRALEHARALLAAEPGWSLEGTLCAAYVKSLAELLPMVATHEATKADVDAFLGQTSLLLRETRGFFLPFPQGGNPTEGGGAEGWARFVDKVYRAALLCCIVAMETAPVEFASHFPICLRSVLDSVMELDGSTLRNVPVKRLVLQTRFVKNALSIRLYNPKAEGMEPTLNLLGIGGIVMPVRMPPMDAGANSDPAGNPDPGVANARQALAVMLGEGICESIVEALITKFLRLTPDELEEWDADPEGRFQGDEAERTTAEAETPRHCGGIVLAHMLAREGTRVADAVVGLAGRYQQRPPQDLANLLNREACYAALEICRGGLGKDRLNFSDWWRGELRSLLQASLGAEHPVPMRALQARAVQVVHSFSGSLSEQDFPVAFEAVSNLLAAPDVVTCLCAARCLTHLALMHVKSAPDCPQMVAVREKSVAALGNAFALANRLSSDECLRTALVLVSGLVEANGTSIEHCLHAIAEQLPPLWERAGDSVPIHSCLIAVLNHLVMKLGYPAVENAHVQKVLFPLLDYCTDISVAHRAETLLEDGLKLWLVTLVTSRLTTMGPSLTALLPRLQAILRQGLESNLSLQVLQFYALLMGVQVVESIAEVTGALLLDCTSYIHDNQVNEANAMVDEEESSKTSSKGGTLNDAIGALNFMEALLQLSPSFGYTICSPALSKVLKAMLQKPLPLPLVEGVFSALGRLLWIRPSALQEILGDDPDQSKHIVALVRTWLQILSGPALAVMLNPALGTTVFIERKGAALSLCAVVCHSPEVAKLVGPSVVSFTKTLLETEQRSKPDVDALVEAACGTARKVVGDGPLGDAAAHTSEMLKVDPLLTTSLADALENAQRAMESVQAPTK